MKSTFLPKDKPNAEGTVGNISTWITAALWDEQFFSLAELNRAIRDKLELFNQRLFQKKESSRLSLFLGEELPLLVNYDFRKYNKDYPMVPEWLLAEQEMEIVL